ncbi:MAG TPA: zinc ribbon domain-containing protein, partial [Candidatus Limnocylindria bacterium]
MAAAATDAVSADEYPPLRVVAWEEDAAIALEPEPIVAAEVVPDEQPDPLVAEELIAAAMVADGDEPEPGVPDPITAATMAAMLAAETHEPEPVTAEVEPEPERPAPEPIRPISETIIPMPQQPPPPQVPDADRVAAVADDASVAARKAQLDLLGIGDPGEGAVADRSNVLPYRSSGASVSAREMAMRTASGLPAPGAFWEASAKEVAGAMSHVGVQACAECGLSLSASARFCRRCGTPQARSA